MSAVQYTVTRVSPEQQMRRLGISVGEPWLRAPVPPPTEQVGRVTVALIQEVTAAHFGIPLAEMVSSRRAKEVARPRQVAMYLSSTMTARSLPEIGRRFGGRDHTTVIHAVKQITKLCASDAELAHAVTAVQTKVRRQAPCDVPEFRVTRRPVRVPVEVSSWCDQCQRSVSSAEAVSCSRSFCKAKSA